MKNNMPEIHYVEFNDTILQTVMKDEIQYVVMKRIAEGIGLDWKGQQAKLLSNPERFNYGDISIVGADGKNRQMGCIPITKLNGWLFSINPFKIPDPEIRNKVILYQEECFIVLHNYWQKGAAINSRVFDENIKVGLFDENAKTTNNINYAINGLCKNADQFLGGKAALTALNYFTGMPIDHLLKDLEEKHKKKTEQDIFSGQKMRVPKSVSDFLSSSCEYRHDAEITKDALYQAYFEFCKENMAGPVARTLFFKCLLNTRKVITVKRRGGDGTRFWTVTGICLKTEMETAE